MIEILKSSPEPVAVTGRAGTSVLFHCNVLHASGHKPLGRGPLAHLRVVQHRRQQAAAFRQSAPRLGGVAAIGMRCRSRPTDGVLKAA